MLRARLYWYGTWRINLSLRLASLLRFLPQEGVHWMKVGEITAIIAVAGVTLVVLRLLACQVLHQ
jgi:hypothetical protein